MSDTSERALGALLAINLLLQILDGVATHAGVSAGFPEGNPIVVRAAALLGLGPALLLLKLQACAWLCLVCTLRRRCALAAPALVVSATVYLAMSAGPWSEILAPIYLPSS